MAQPTGPGSFGEKRWSGGTQYAYRQAGDSGGRWFSTGETREPGIVDQGAWQRKDGKYIKGPGTSGPYDSPVYAKNPISPTRDRINTWGNINQDNLEAGWDNRKKYDRQEFDKPEPGFGQMNAQPALYRTGDRKINDVFKDINARRDSLESDYVKWLPGYRGVRNDDKGAPRGQTGSSAGDPRADMYRSDDFKLWSGLNGKKVLNNAGNLGRVGVQQGSLGLEGRVAELKNDLAAWEQEKTAWDADQDNKQLEWRWGDNVSLNKLLADQFEFGGNFGRSGFNQHYLGAENHLQQSIADFLGGYDGPLGDYEDFLEEVEEQDFGKNVDLNQRLTKKFGYEGDYGGQGWRGFYYDQAEPRQDTIDSFINKWRRNADLPRLPTDNDPGYGQDRDYGDKAAKNRALADRFGYQGDFSDGGFSKFYQRQGDKRQGQIADFLENWGSSSQGSKKPSNNRSNRNSGNKNSSSGGRSRDYGDNKKKNKRLAEATGYKGDFSDGGFNKFYLNADKATKAKIERALG